MDSQTPLTTPTTNPTPAAPATPVVSEASTTMVQSPVVVNTQSPQAFAMSTNAPSTLPTPNDSSMVSSTPMGGVQPNGALGDSTNPSKRSREEVHPPHAVRITKCAKYDQDGDAATQSASSTPPTQILDNLNQALVELNNKGYAQVVDEILPSIREMAVGYMNTIAVKASHNMEIKHMASELNKQRQLVESNRQADYHQMRDTIFELANNVSRVTGNTELQTAVDKLQAIDDWHPDNFARYCNPVVMKASILIGNIKVGVPGQAQALAPLVETGESTNSAVPLSPVPACDATAQPVMDVLSTKASVPMTERPSASVFDWKTATNRTAAIDAFMKVPTSSRLPVVNVKASAQPNRAVQDVHQSATGNMWSALMGNTARPTVSPLGGDLDQQARQFSAMFK
jgi:hypothetical protein